MRFSVYQVSRRGGRAKNEDRMGYCYTRSAGLFALADGMGGHPEGEVAAQMALQALAAAFQREAKPALKDPSRFLTDGILAGHHQLLHHAIDRGLLDTPRTTLVACIIQDGRIWWAHCGDSRFYHLRGTELLRRTRDHSYSELQGTSTLTPQAQPMNRNVLFTCLGSPGKPVIDLGGPERLQAGDRLMVCSDGLWSPLPDAAIVEVLSQLPIGEAVPELAERALRKAGPKSDNVTLLACEWEGDDPPEQASHGIATKSLGDEVFASTIQASLGPGDANSGDMTEAEMERSIREINEAIKRTRQAVESLKPIAPAAPSGPKPKR